MTVKTVKELKNNFNFDVRSIDQPDVIETLVEDDERTLDLLVAALGDKVTDVDDLLLAMGGEELEAAIWAFIYGCVFFFRSHKRSAMLELLNNIQEIQNHCGYLMTEKVKLNSEGMKEQFSQAVSELEI